MLLLRKLQNIENKYKNIYIHMYILCFSLIRGFIYNNFQNNFQPQRRTSTKERGGNVTLDKQP